MISKAQLGYFYQARRKMDQAVGQLFGHDVHLHDLSQQSAKSNQLSNSFGNKNIGQIQISSQNNINNNTNTSNNLRNNVQINPIRKNPQKINDFYMNVNNQSKMEKMYKENIQLQKKMMGLKDQNQLYKHKALLWEKIKQFILDNIHQQYKLKSIKFNTSDSAIVEEFLTVLQDLLKKSKEITTGKGIQTSDHSMCRQLLEDSKRKVEEQSKKVSKLLVEIELLTNQNHILKDRQNNTKKERKARIDQIQEGMNEKFVQIQNSLIEKTKENKQLQKKIVSLQSEIYQLRNASSPLRKKQKTITTQADSIRDNSEVDLLRKISKVKDDEINTLKQQGRLLSGQIFSLKNTNQKMKKVIKMAQTLNNEFIQKIEDSMRRSQRKGLNQLAISEYDPDRIIKNMEIEKDFHLVNKRFKIVKTRSLEKQKFSYGQKGRT